MTYWEFLLQQEGDRTWLPLETAHVEILEGRYRIVAHTSHNDIPVDIHLTQLLAEQLPPKRRNLKRQGHTNGDGLMVVMPFTHLTAGTWTIRCSAVAAANQSADRLDYGVQLRVVPVEDDPDNWLPDWDIPEDDPLPVPLQTLAEPSATGLKPVPGATAPQASLNQVSTALPEVSDDFPEIEAQPLDALPLRLLLEQQALMARPQQPLTLTGQVIAMGDESTAPGVGSLGLQLRDPDRGKVVARLSRSLHWTTLPTVFEITIPVPEVPGTRLLVGEMSLWQGTVAAPQIMAIQGFTVTTNLDSLLEAVTQRGDAGLTFQEDTLGEAVETSAQPTDPTPSAEAAQLEAETAKTTPLDMPAVREVPFRLIYLPASGLTLPPKIQPSPPTGQLPRALALPTLPNQPLRPASQSAKSPQKSLELPLIAPPSQAGSADLAGIEPAAATPDAVSGLEQTVELPPLGQLSPGQGSSKAGAPAGYGDETIEAEMIEAETLEAESLSASSTPVPDPGSDPDFTALNLKDRFWGRLTALAQDGHAAAADLKREMTAAGVEAELDQAGESPVDLPAVTPSLPAMTVTAPSHEVVIYDEPEPPSNSPTQGIGTTDLPDAPGSEALETLVVPVPQVELPDSTLVAGDPLALTVSLPPFPHRLAVKFWMTDIQNRSLIEKPRWLMNWTPAFDGQSEALLHLQVPMGCLEVRFEAIAVDLATQEESHKVTLQRTIIPSQGAITPLEDLP